MKWGASVALLLVLLCGLLIGCGGDDEEGQLSPEQRMENMEAQLTGLQQFIAQEFAKDEGQQSVVVEVSEENGEVVSTTAYIASPLYSLERSEASDNEIEIVEWMADCAAKTYLNPELPREVVQREVKETEERMWEALESGQYSSFEAYIGMAFSFCHARLVEGE